MEKPMGKKKLLKGIKLKSGKGKSNIFKMELKYFKKISAPKLKKMLVMR